jgi:hypothetical protein
MHECERDKIKVRCNCTYEPCQNKGICCLCIRYHRSNDEVPACFFSKEAERTYDRSIENYFRDMKKKKA